MSAAVSVQAQTAKPQAVSNSKPPGLLVQRQCACGSSTSNLTGACPKCQKKRLQPKLRIGASNDPLEQEADRVADQVMSTTTNPTINSTPPRIQRLTTHSGGENTSAPASVDRVLASGGRPLEPALQQDMSQRFGHDFSRVRVHSGAAAAQSARDVSAHAYTVGHDIVFGAGRFAPGTHEGQRLLAHEMTHVVQQSGADGNRVGQGNETHGLSPICPAMLQRKGGTIGGFFSNIGRSIASIFVDEPGYSDATLQAYLKVLDDTNDIEDDYDSDDKARIVVKRWMAGASGFALSRERKVLLIEEMIVGPTGDADEAAIIDVLADSPDAELTYILSKVTPKKLRGEIHGEERDQLERLLGGWIARAGSSAPRDIFAGTKAVTETQHANVEHVLNPTTILVPPPPGPVGIPPPPPTVVDPDPMTDTGPGGAFESEMLTMLNTNVGGWGGDFRALRAESGQPAFPVPSANRIADAAQGETERYFSPYIRVASRGIADRYHPGAYSLRSQLGDQSTRPLTDADRRGWMEYWMTLRAPNCRAAPCGQNILDSHKYLGSRDIGELRRVRDRYMSAAAHMTDIDDAIHSWGAEAGTGTVFIQPYQRIPDEDKKRTNRWELFTVLIHEFMHVLMHPNFSDAANRIGGTAGKILAEGFAEVMRTELWSGTGKLRSRLSSTEMTPLRAQVEGKRYDYKDSVVKDSGYYDQLSDASRIDAEIGHENAKNAFFLGHVELLGLGAGTRTEGGPLAGVAMYEPTDSPDAEVVVAPAGDTYADIRARSGATPGGLLDDTTGVPLSAGAAIAPGTRVRIPGIRWIRAIVNDTLGGVAQQHNVTVSALAAANGFPAGAPAATPLITGSRILIPIHRNPP